MEGRKRKEGIKKKRWLWYGDGRWRQEDPRAWVPAAEPNPCTLGSVKDCFNFTNEVDGN